MWALGKLNHVAIAVPDLQAATAMYRDMLGADVSGEQVIVKTYCQIVCTKRVHCVSKILTPRRMLQKTRLIA